MTNYEKIKFMSIEEMVTLMCELSDLQIRSPYYISRCMKKSSIRKWLETEDVEVVSIKHGHWEKLDGYVCGDYHYRCSECGEDYWESEGFPDRAHFCSNCGAKMEKE